jgi:ribosome-associated translation inhibitor RaiA
MDQNENMNNEIQSYIYQQIAEFEPFISPETLVLVIARDPNETETAAEQAFETTDEKSIHRIAIVLKEDNASIEAEALHTNIFEAIRFAKENLLQKLIEIQNEVENPKERLNAIQQASSNEQIH